MDTEAGMILGTEHLGSRGEGTGSLFQVTDIEQAPIFFPEMIIIFLEWGWLNHMSLHIAVWEVSVINPTMEGMWAFRVWGWGACRGVWEAWRGWEGGVPAEKEWGGIKRTRGWKVSSQQFCSPPSPLQCVF